MRRGNDPRVFSQDAASHLRAVLLADIAGDDLARLLEITPEDAARFQDQASRANREQLMRSMELFMRVESEMKWATQPRTILELAAVRACHPEQEPDAALAERLECIEHKLESGAFVSAAPSAAKAPAPAPAPKPAQSAKTADVPADAPPQEYLDAIEKVSTDNPSIRSMLGKMRFAGVQDDAVIVRFGRDAVIMRRLLEGRAQLIEAALSDAYGRPMRLQMQNESDAPARTNATARSVIDQSLDVFGRDKIEFTD